MGRSGDRREFRGEKLCRQLQAGWQNRGCRHHRARYSKLRVRDGHRKFRPEIAPGNSPLKSRVRIHLEVLDVWAVAKAEQQQKKRLLLQVNASSRAQPTITVPVCSPDGSSSGKEDK